MWVGSIIETPTLLNLTGIQVLSHTYMLEPGPRTSLSCAHHKIQKLKQTKEKKVPLHFSSLQVILCPDSGKIS